MAQDVTDPIEVDQAGPFILDIEHYGDAHFGVKLSNISGRGSERLINTIGDFDGRVIAPVRPGKHVFEVDYGREYSIEPVDFGEIQTAPISLDRTDPYVIPIELENPIKIELLAEGDNHVGVSLRNGIGEKVDNLVNEIGPTETTTLVQQEGEGFLFFDIEGNWSAEITEI